MQKIEEHKRVWEGEKVKEEEYQAEKELEEHNARENDKIEWEEIDVNV